MTMMTISVCKTESADSCNKLTESDMESRRRNSEAIFTQAHQDQNNLRKIIISSSWPEEADYS